MKKPDKLYELIQSMSMSEKRYFKLYASRHTIGEKNNYTTLFDVMEEMLIYSSAELLALLKKRKVSTRHISSDKNYLYHLILRGLSAYHTGKTVSLEVKELLHQIEILYLRGFYDHCLPILKKAMKKSEKYDLYPMTLEIASWQRKILRREGDLERVMESLNDSMNHMALLDNLNAYMKLYFQISRLQARKDKVRSLEDRAIYDEFIIHPFLEDESIALTHMARIYFWRCHARYNYVVDEPTEELAANERLLNLMEEDPAYVQEYPSEYITVHSRILNLKRNRSDEEFEGELKTFRDFPNQLKRSRRKLEAEVDSLSVLIEMRRMLENRKFGMAVRIFSDSTAVLQRYRRLIPGKRLAHFHYLHAYMFVGIGEYAKALPHLNPVLNDKFDQVGMEIQTFSRMLNLIVHFELGNDRLLRYNTDATLRYLKKNDYLYPVENCFIELFRSLLKSKTKEQQYDHFRRCKAQLSDLLQDHYTRNTLAYFDMQYWLERKISG